MVILGGSKLGYGWLNLNVQYGSFEDNMQLNNAYKKEEHVRVAIIARICQALGWDIGNPEEFYPEFPIKLKNKEGSVDVVLFHSQLKEKTPDVFFELKSVGKLKGNIESSEDQLQEYNYYNAASITVLTDGRQWRFYLSSAPGTFSQRLFCSFDLSEDAEEYIISVLINVLSKNRFVKDAVNTAQSMLLDLKLSREIGRAKSEADNRSNRYPNLNKYQLVQAIMTERGHNVSIEEIIRLWDKTILGDVPLPPPAAGLVPIPPPQNRVKVFISARGVKASGLYNFVTNPTLPPPGQKQVFSAYFSALKDKYYENYIFINDCKRTD